MFILAGTVEAINGIIALITGLCGLIGTGIGAFFAIKNFIALNKNKKASDIWKMIITIADTAMKEAEASGKKGAAKKEMVMDAVKAGCKAADINIDLFIDQLSAYIDQTIDFVNGMKK